MELEAQKQKLLDQALADWEADQAASEPTAAADEGASSAPAAPKLADVHVEGAVEIDQDVYDQLIADGKSERIARAKAKAAWVKKQKQRKLDEGDA
jgi:hypothetical protein